MDLHPRETPETEIIWFCEFILPISVSCFFPLELEAESAPERPERRNQQYLTFWGVDGHVPLREQISEISQGFHGKRDGMHRCASLVPRTPGELYSAAVYTSVAAVPSKSDWI